MAHVESGSSGGRKISVDLNLVPFIDLMSVLITFLLITAVWTQVSMIQIGSSLYAKKDPNQPPPTPPPHADVVLKLDVRANGYFLTVGTQTSALPLVSGVYDKTGLVAQLQKVKELYPDKIDAVVSMEDGIAYEQLIIAMDQFLVSGFSSISIATGGPG